MKRLKRSALTLAIVVPWAVLITGASSSPTKDPTSWDCRTMGDRVCGPRGGEPSLTPGIPGQ